MRNIVSAALGLSASFTRRFRSPLCTGITHDPEALSEYGHVYWAVDGNCGTLIRFDFEKVRLAATPTTVGSLMSSFFQPHGPGSMDHTRALVHRYTNVQLSRKDGIPSHVALDPATRTLYMADTGANRVLAVQVPTPQSPQERSLSCQRSCRLMRRSL